MTHSRRRESVLSCFFLSNNGSYEDVVNGLNFSSGKPQIWQLILPDLNKEILRQLPMERS
jgi:hypothetical protein